MHQSNALQEAIQKAGNQEKLADLMNKAAKSIKGSPIRKRRFSQQNVSWWLNESHGLVPAEVAPVIEIATGVSKHRLRPDVFGIAA